MMAHDLASSRTGSQAVTNFLLWASIAVYAIARILQVFPSNVPMLAIVALHVAPPMLFALVHGAIFYKTRGIFAFFAICLIVGNVVENVGARTGFPYGSYYFTGVMGPKLFAVPILLGLAYLGMAYLSWTLARIILGGFASPLCGSRVVALPLIAAFIMVAWDFSMDPVWSTIVHAWIWLKGGAYFGVPLSNFLGWYLTVYLMFQIFALYLKGRPANPGPFPPNYWRLPVLFYGVSAAGNLLLLIPSPQSQVIADASDAQWRVTDIVGACALVSIFLMGAFALLAWVRVNIGGNEARG